tara:strand:- start:746 stop:1561 length:816 start_codon:yes stop_codon:yes gene_type:complete
MSYIGNDLKVAFNSYRIIDDISSGFNGSQTTFALTIGSTAPTPFPSNPQQLLISVNGVVQEPDPSGSAGFTLSGSNIVFSSAPANGHAFFGVMLAGADYVTAGDQFPDGSNSGPSITFSNDTDTGFYRASSGVVGLAENGVARTLQTLEANQTITGVKTYNAAAIAEVTTLSNASATIAVDLSLSNNFTVTLNATTATVGAPTNAVAGQSGSIFIVQDGTGSRTLAWNNNWKFSGSTVPTLSTDANAVDRVDYICRSSTEIQAVWTGDYKR